MITCKTNFINYFLATSIEQSFAFYYTQFKLFHQGYAFWYCKFFFKFQRFFSCLFQFFYL